MKRLAYNKRRDANEIGIVEILTTLGCVVHRLDDPADLLVNRKGKLHLIEVKTLKGIHTAKQKLDMARWPITTIRTIEQAQDFARGA